MTEPNPLFIVVSRYFWLVAIVVTCINAAVWWRRSQPHIAKRPELKDSYWRLIRGWVIFSSIPWIVMGIGILFGRVAGLFSYFDRPMTQGPYVIAWFVSAAILLILAAVWTFFMRGAETLVEHPGILNVSGTTPAGVKAFVIVWLVASAVFMGLLFFGVIAPAG